jgi:hypothetical protein
MRALSSTPLKVYLRARVAIASLAAGALSLVFSPIADAQPAAMRQPAVLQNSSPLCDSHLVPCLDIDDFAAHAYAHLMVVPKTEGHGVAALIPYGVALGLPGRFAGGATSYASWSQNETPRHGHSPLHLSVTALLASLALDSQRPSLIADPTSFPPRL